MSVHDFKATGRQTQPTMPVAHGGEPPYDDGMETRVAKLENFAQDTRDRLSRIETKLDGTATKAEVADLKAEVHKALGEQTWRLFGAILTFGTLLSAAVFFIARNVK